MRKGQRGQAIIIVVVALGILLIGALGLAIDGGSLYAHRTMAQAAADAAAQAGMLSVFNGTNTGSNAFGSSAHTCTTTDAITPCVYARRNGFGGTSDDTVYIDFPSAAAVGMDPASLAAVSVNLLRVTITRNVSTGLLRMLSSTTAMPVKAVAVAAQVEVMSPVPILVLHPTLNGSFAKNGVNTIKICGGPSRSIQVNSASLTSVDIAGISGKVDLQFAGPKNTSPTACDGTGADFGNHGGPNTYPGTFLPGADGAYRPHVSKIVDPLLSVAPPTQPTTPGSYVTYTPGTHGCPVGLGVECRVYSPGYYASGIDLGGSNKAFALFRPGIYYINHGGFHLGPNSIARMAIGSDASDPTTGTGWTEGMLMYNSPTGTVNATQDRFEITANSGKINGLVYPDAVNGCPDGGNCLVGSPLSPYKYILFFQNRSTATSIQHSLQGGGGLSIVGTIYLTHTETSILGDGNYQSLDLQGTSGSATKILGQIIVDTLSLGGTSDIVMTLRADAIYTVRQIALVK